MMENSTEMRVTKRDGELQEVAFDKILERATQAYQKYIQKHNEFFSTIFLVKI